MLSLALLAVCSSSLCVACCGILVAMRQLPEGQLLACRWPCRVWWAQLAAAEEWQPLVPAAYDSVGDSL